MLLTNMSTSAVVELSDDMQWIDEFAWSAVVQSKEYTITGALVIDEGVKAAGRPITLEGRDGSGGYGWGWMTLQTLRTLQAWRGAPGLQMSLVIGGSTKVVKFDHERGAIEAKPVEFFSDPQDADQWVVTLRFIEV
jgi:hypothetical protein